MSSSSRAADSLTDELIDLLTMTRGLRVLASGAVANLRDNLDVRTAGQTLVATTIVDGTVYRRQDEVRIVARLIDVDTGIQRWSCQFQGQLQDVFDLQDRLAKRVAEALRVKLTMVTFFASPRKQSVLRQLAVEMLARLGATELALEHLYKADALGLLIDADWLDACPMLAPLRDKPEFVSVRLRVHGRADAVWRTGSDAADSRRL